MRMSVDARSLIARRGGANSHRAAIEQLEPRTLLTTIFGPTPAVTPGVSTYGEVVADFDGDGINDLAGLENIGAQNSILFFKGRGDGSFAAPLRTVLNV